jgi:hypothetical protein
MTRRLATLAALFALAGGGSAAAQGFQGTPPGGAPPAERAPDAAADKPQSFPATVGGTKLTLIVPAGFCRLDPNQPGDRRMLDVQEQVQRGQNLVLLFAADCAQLRDWRAGSRPVLDDFMIYLAPTALAGRDLNMTPAQFVAEMRKIFEQQGARMIESSKDDVKKRVEDATTVKINETRFIGILHADTRALYVGIIQRLKPEAGGEKSQVGISGVGLVRGKAVSLNAYGNLAEGPEKPLKVFAWTREAYEAMLRANPPNR